MPRLHFFLRRLTQITAKNLMVFRTRVILTVCGIFIGIVSVISTFTVNQNLSRLVEEELKKFGSNSLFLSSRIPSRIFAPDEVEAIRDYGPSVRSVVQVASTYFPIASTDESSGAEVFGVDAGFFALKQMATASGRAFAETDARERVAVVGSELAGQLFGKWSPIGKVLRIGKHPNAVPYRVVGVLQPQGKSQFLSSAGNPDYSAYVPYESLRSHLAHKKGGSLILQALSEDHIVSAKDQVLAILKKRHGDKLKVMDPREEIQRNRKMIDGMVTAGVTIGILCLISGGIGIMNIMLVSVMQRRREIGLYKAIGFSDRAILIQFLAESLAICLIGAVIGIAAGVPTGSLMSKILLKGFSAVNIPSIFISVAFSFVVGIFFGYLPAKRASDLDPVEALRG